MSYPVPPYALTSCGVPCAPTCPAQPPVPNQGALMPVLFNPTQYTSSALLSPSERATYTLLVITTEWINVGVLFRFQMYDGFNKTYAECFADDTIAQWDLIIRKAIPPGTVVVCAVTSTSTSMYAFSGTDVYASGGKGVPETFLVNQNSLLAFAFAPTPSGSWIPTNGNPMFAIGFNYPDQNTVQAGDTVCNPAAPLAAQLTAPNFPDQYSPATPGVLSWTFLYEVVYPYTQVVLTSDVTSECLEVIAIKVGSVPLYPSGSWTNLRDWIAQPWTVITENNVSASRWVPYDSAVDTPDVGPFTLAAMGGQLVCVYFKPTYKDIDNPDMVKKDVDEYAAAAFLVTSPLQPNMTVYFTNLEYNDAAGGFGPRKDVLGPAQFVTYTPAFEWSTGASGIRAGTVVYFNRIGANSGNITVVDAHDNTVDVGSISRTYINGNGSSVDGQAVPSLIVLGVWVQTGAVYSSSPLDARTFVTAALSDQYAGDFPPLSPCVTINQHRFIGESLYGKGLKVNGEGMPATVQAPIINSALFEQVTDPTLVTPDTVNTVLPVFYGMSCFSW
jgi:hypothetical protein